MQQNINSTTIGTVKPMSYAELDIERITLQEQAQIGELYMLAKKELYLLDPVKKEKVRPNILYPEIPSSERNNFVITDDNDNEEQALEYYGKCLSIGGNNMYKYIKSKYFFRINFTILYF